MVKGMEELTEDERKALRGSKFAPLPPVRTSSSISSSSSMPRLAHPGGPVKTNKAAALAKFLERKLQEPGGLDTLKPELIELAVKNAKETVNATGMLKVYCIICPERPYKLNPQHSCTGGTSKHGKTIQHVTSFDEYEDHSFKDGSTSKPEKKRKKDKKTQEEKQEKEKGSAS